MMYIPNFDLIGRQGTSHSQGMYVGMHAYQTKYVLRSYVYPA